MAFCWISFEGAELRNPLIRAAQTWNDDESKEKENASKHCVVRYFLQDYLD